MSSPEQDILIFINGEPYSAPPGKTLLSLILSQRLSIKTACGGKATCHLCRVTITKGRDTLPPPSIKEERALGNLLIDKGVRLSCQVPITDTLHVTLPKFESLKERRLRKKQIGNKGARSPKENE